MHAVVPAAGEGRHRRPLPAVVPKPMLPVGDRSLSASAMAAAVASRPGVGAAVDEDAASDVNEGPDPYGVIPSRTRIDPWGTMTRDR